MHFAQTLFVGASAFAAFVAAQSNTVLFTGTPNSVTAGTASTISYQVNDKTTPVTIILRKGNPNDLQTIANLTTTSTGGKFVWTPSKSLVDGSDYALEITQGSEINYSKEFALIGGAAAVASSASSSSAAASSTPATTMAAPYPAGNATAPYATGTGAVTSTPTGILPGSSSTMSPVVTVSSTTGSAPAATTSKTSGASALSGSLSLVLAAVAAVAYLQ